MTIHYALIVYGARIRKERIWSLETEKVLVYVERDDFEMYMLGIETTDKKYRRLEFMISPHDSKGGQSYYVGFCKKAEFGGELVPTPEADQSLVPAFVEKYLDDQRKVHLFTDDCHCCH